MRYVSCGPAFISCWCYIPVANSQDSSAVTAEWPKGALRPVIDHRGQQVIQIRHALLLFFLLTLSLSFSLNSARAIAQDDPGSEAPELDDSIVIEEVFVTGSLLPKGDFVSKAPVATISSTQFEMSNTTNVEALINSMPQVVGEQTGLLLLVKVSQLQTSEALERIAPSCL